MKYYIRLYFIIQLVFHFGLGNTYEEEEDYERGWESNVCQLISGEFLNKLSTKHTHTDKYKHAGTHKITPMHTDTQTHTRTQITDPYYSHGICYHRVQLVEYESHNDPET